MQYRTTGLLLFALLFAATAITQPEIDHTVYLIGDTGAPELDGSDPVFDNLKKRLDQESKHSTIVFLGDNIYHNGLPPASHSAEERKKAEQKILVQLDALKEYKGKVYFIPGNHDWNDASSDGLSYIRAQEEFIEFYMDRGDVLLPDHGCPGPEVKKLGKNGVLIAMDSQWWLHPHPEKDQEESPCKNKNTAEVMQELKELLDKYDDRFVVLAFHHPLYSDGSHSGFFQIKDHLFPLAALNKSLLIPLPGLGSLYPFYRSAFGDRQDMPHPIYQDFKAQMLNAVKGYSNIVLASGHEHNLQYFMVDGNHHIKSGSGSKSAKLPKINKAEFNSEKKGYAKVEYYKNGQAKLYYYTIEDANEQVAYTKTIIDKPLSIPKDVESYELDKNKVTASAHKEYMTSGIHRALFGNLYRKDWETPVELRAINLTKEKGGLTPIKAGGGMTSNSLRLVDKNKKQYVLRSVQKSVTKVVPHDFQNSIVQDIFQDQIAASQPYAALAVHPLAEALGIYHTHPEIVYLPKQQALGDFEKTYGDELYLFEERPAGDREDEDNFGNSKKIISFSKMLKKTRNSPDHHVHQEQVLRSRLFDFYLGDWDRHDDQWRWASFKEQHQHGHDDEGEVTFYEPIPRDRDQVFFQYKGFVPWIAKLLSPQVRKFQTFGNTINNVKYLGFNARHFDRSFLNQMGQDDWVAAAKSISELLTDDVIDESINNLPGPIRDLRGDFYTSAFKSRRELLPKYAREYAAFLSKYVDVVGTNQVEHFVVERKPDNTTHVIVYEVEDGLRHGVIYERTFNSLTKEIRLYGLDGDDIFNISGQQGKGPIVRIIGGKGNDHIENTSRAGGAKKSTVIYDSVNGNKVVLGPDAKDKRSNDFRDNLYDRKEFYYNSVVGYVLAGFNPDNGLRLNYTQSIATYGFKKSPYNALHNIRATFATATKELGISYELQLTDVVNKTDFNLETSFFLPSDNENFFGLGNESRVDISNVEDFEFYRYRQTSFFIKPAAQWVSKYRTHNLKIGPYYHYTQLRTDADRFIADRDENDLPLTAFDNKNYVGLSMDYNLLKVDNATFPTIGMDFKLSSSYNLNVSDTDESFTKIYGALTLYNYLWIPKPFVLATKIEGGSNFGQFSFFQANYIGNNNGLRSFRQNRFGGHSSFLLSNDLRLRVGQVNNRTIPFSFGLIGAYDYGRVWSENETSNTWHQSYGGGFWINPFDITPISFYYMTSPENESIFMFKFGFPF